MSKRWILFTMVFSVLFTVILLKWQMLLSRAAVSAEIEVGEMTVIQPLIRVLITGAVKKPGYYEIPKNSLRYDLVQRAGGLLETANVDTKWLSHPIAKDDFIQVPILPPISQVVNTSQKKNQTNTTRININRANHEQLAKLPGIGDRLATYILADRQKSGPFQKIEDLKRVKGIGVKRLKLIQPFLTLK